MERGGHCREALHEAIEAVPESEWMPYGETRQAEIREFADVPLVPGEKSEKKDMQPLRYVVIRIRHKQGSCSKTAAGYGISRC